MTNVKRVNREEWILLDNVLRLRELSGFTRLATKFQRVWLGPSRDLQQHAPRSFCHALSTSLLRCLVKVNKELFELQSADAA
ncbi:hypothetical protein RvY_02273 [Ramazzottius varieornatus]|uniref:Uncharacterized protein n=1 Tax=Ramazzottius varieornatus TaxID=947166 RepID=A0A1D1UQ22_RAMVA|nr:hypothetical protein RvY_02273 [Ramazzottius varieornatus]